MAMKSLLARKFNCQTYKANVMSVDKEGENPQSTVSNAEVGKRTDTNEAIKEAHDQAEADIENDVELTDAAGPLEDLDEEESFRERTDETDHI